MQVALELDSDWGRFYLDSQLAVIETPEGTPNNVACAYSKAIFIRRPSTSAEFFKFECVFSITHNKDTFDFSVAHGTIGTTTMTGGSLKVRFLNGGERVGQQTVIGGRNLQTFTDVELTQSREQRTPWRGQGCFDKRKTEAIGWM